MLIRKLDTYVLLLHVFIFFCGCLSSSSEQLKNSSDSSVSNINAPKRPTTKDVFLVIGQSNAAGRRSIEAQDTSYLPGVYLLNEKDCWEPAKNPLNKHSSIRKKLSMQKLNFAYSFSKKIIETTGREIGLVVNASGGTITNQWLKNAPDGYFNSA